MRKTLLALSLAALVSGNAAIAQGNIDSSASSAAADSNVQKLDMPAIKSRRHMLFSFGLFGTGFHLGWKKPKDKDEAQGEFRGIGSPILYTSVGHHAFGLGTPKKEVKKL